MPLEVEQASLVPGLQRNSCTRAAAVVKPTDMPLWQAAKPSPRATWVLPVPLLPTAMTFSRRWMYSHRASSSTRALFSDGMAGKSKVSRLFTAAFYGGKAGGADPPSHHALVAVDELKARRGAAGTGDGPHPRRRTARPASRTLSGSWAASAPSDGVLAAASTGGSCRSPRQQGHVVPGGRGAHPDPGQVGIELQIQPGRPPLQPTQHQVFHRVEADGSQPSWRPSPPQPPPAGRRSPADGAPAPIPAYPAVPFGTPADAAASRTPRVEPSPVAERPDPRLPASVPRAAGSGWGRKRSRPDHRNGCVWR